MKNAENIKKFLNKYKKQIILITAIIIVIIAVTIIMLKRNQIKNNAETQIAKEIENNKIELNVEIKEETDTNYNCLLTFTSNDENDKIKSIEYPVKDGETNPYILNVAGENGKDKIAIDYKIDKGDIDKNFKVTTTNGSVINENTSYTIYYYKNGGNVNIDSDKQLKSLPIKLPEAYKDGYLFLGWSIDANSDKVDYKAYINDNIMENKNEIENIKLYAVYKNKNDILEIQEDNNSLISKVNYIKNTETTQINIKDVKYNLNLINIDGDLLLDGKSNVNGAELSNNIYEFGNKETDVATESEDAKNMVVLKVNGNLTIDEGVTLTACKSENGYGGPKGLLIYCTGTLTNNGTIDMTARGARAEGQDVYLWKNTDNSYEYVPAVGTDGGNKVEGKKGNNGVDGENRKLAGGGSGGGRTYVKRGYGGARRKWNFIFRRYRRWTEVLELRPVVELVVMVVFMVVLEEKELGLAAMEQEIHKEEPEAC